MGISSGDGGSFASAAVTRVKEKERAPARPTETDLKGATGRENNPHLGLGEVATSEAVPQEDAIGTVRWAAAAAA